MVVVLILAVILAMSWFGNSSYFSEKETEIQTTLGDESKQKPVESIEEEDEVDDGEFEDKPVDPPVINDEIRH